MGIAGTIRATLRHRSSLNAHYAGQSGLSGDATGQPVYLWSRHKRLDLPLTYRDPGISHSRPKTFAAGSDLIVFRKQKSVVTSSPFGAARLTTAMIEYPPAMRLIIEEDGMHQCPRSRAPERDAERPAPQPAFSFSLVFSPPTQPRHVRSSFW